MGDDFKKIMKWYTQADVQIRKAGGYPEGVLAMFPENLLETLIRNDIYIVYKENKGD